jgi:hypothetical protein
MNETEDPGAVEDVIEVVSDLGRFVAYLNETAVTLIFGILFVSLIIYIVRLHFGNSEYQKFRLAHMVMKLDGTLDRKAMKDTVLFMTSMYGFFFVMHKHPDLLVSYFWALAVVWCGMHLADKKLPTPPLPPTITPEPKP